MLILSTIAIIFITGMFNTLSLPYDIEEKEFLKIFLYSFFLGFILLPIKIIKGIINVTK